MESPEGEVFEGRLGALEEVLKLDARLQTVEATIAEKTGKLGKPWWRSTTAITILASLATAIFPILSLINNCFLSYRESRRLFVEQQERIRQTYLDRVLRPGVTEAEQQRVFVLLSRLSSDSELQAWAKDELKKTTDSLAALTEQKKVLERNWHEAEARLSRLNSTMSKAVNSERSQRIAAEMAAAAARKQLEDVNQRLGTSIPTVTGTNCKIRVSSDPPGANVQFSVAGNISPGIVKGPTTPGEIVLPIENYIAKFSKEGYLPEERVVRLRQVADCNQEVFVTLKQAHTQ